jgi:hypothetical protein
MLRSVEFSFQMQSPKWVSAALQTISRDNHNFKRITIEVDHLPNDPTSSHPEYSIHSAREAAVKAYLELDQLLVEFHRLRSITPRIVSSSSLERNMMSLLPNLAGLGAVRVTRQDTELVPFILRR